MSDDHSKIRKEAAERIAAIEGDRDLTPEGKARRIAAIESDRAQKLRDLNAKLDTDRQTAREAEMRNWLRPPGGHTAESRAMLAEAKAKLRKPDDVHDALVSARISGDQLAEWAAAAVAAEMRFSPIPGRARGADAALEEWAGGDASRRERIESLASTMTNQPSLAQRIMDRAGQGVSAATSSSPEYGSASQDLTPAAQKREGDLNQTFRASVGGPYAD